MPKLTLLDDDTVQASGDGDPILPPSEESNLRFIERPLASVTYKNGSVLVSADELAETLEKMTKSNPPGKQFSTPAQVIDTIFAGRYHQGCVDYKRVPASRYEVSSPEDPVQLQLDSELPKPGAIVVLNHGVVSNHPLRSVLMKAMRTNAIDWDEDLKEALREAQRTINVAAAKHRAKPKDVFSVRLHDVESLGPNDPLSYPHTCVDNPDNSLAWLGDGGGMYWISMCIRVQFDGVEGYLEVVKLGASDRGLGERIPEVIAKFKRFGGWCKVRFVFHTEKAFEVEALFQRMASDLGLLHGCFDKATSEGRRELMCLSPSQILLVRDTAIRAALQLTSWSDLVNVHEIVKSAPSVKLVPHIPRDADDLSDIGNGDDDNERVGTDDVDVFIDNYGVVNGQFGFRSGLLNLSDTQLQMACMRRGLDEKSLTTRDDYIEALWVSCEWMVNQRNVKKRKVEDKIALNTLSIELIRGQHQTMLELMLSQQQIFQGMIQQSEDRCSRQFDTLKSLILQYDENRPPTVTTSGSPTNWSEGLCKELELHRKSLALMSAEHQLIFQEKMDTLFLDHQQYMVDLQGTAKRQRKKEQEQFTCQLQAQAKESSGLLHYLWTNFNTAFRMQAVCTPTAQASVPAPKPIENEQGSWLKLIKQLVDNLMRKYGVEEDIKKTTEQNLIATQLLRERVEALELKLQGPPVVPLESIPTTNRPRLGQSTTNKPPLDKLRGDAQLMLDAIKAKKSTTRAAQGSLLGKFVLPKQ